MAMSTDRVSFVLPYSGYNYNYSRSESMTSGQRALVKAAIVAFSIPQPAVIAAMNNGVKIICRPSQFARFLILRNDFGGSNDFKGLKAELIPAPTAQTLDVSSRPAKGF